MDKNALSTLNELNRRIGSLQAKRDALIKREKEKKAKAQEKWKASFMKELVKGIEKTCGDDYEEKTSPEETAAYLSSFLDRMPGCEKPGSKEGRQTMPPDEKTCPEGP